MCERVGFVPEINSRGFDLEQRNFLRLTGHSSISWKSLPYPYSEGSPCANSLLRQIPQSEAEQETDKLSSIL